MKNGVLALKKLQKQRVRKKQNLKGFQSFGNKYNGIYKALIAKVHERTGEVERDAKNLETENLWTKRWEKEEEEDNDEVYLMVRMPSLKCLMM